MTGACRADSSLGVHSNQTEEPRLPWPETVWYGITYDGRDDRAEWFADLELDRRLRSLQVGEHVREPDLV
jgi:hypothetical protein